MVLHLGELGAFNPDQWNCEAVLSVKGSQISGGLRLLGLPELLLGNGIARER